MTFIPPPRRYSPAQTVCSICGAIHPATEAHTCTHETQPEGEPMLDHPDKITTDVGIVLPATNVDREIRVRLTCLRLAAETGMPADKIQATADDWANWALGTNQKEN